MQRHPALWLLGNEYLKLQRANLKGIEAYPENDNLLTWQAKVNGLEGTLWEGAVLQLSLKFDEDYNSVPPTVKFKTIPFHPNVNNETGRPCILYLDSSLDWQPGISISSILLTLQTMLSNPVLEAPVNPQAAELLMASPSTYERLVLDFVLSSQEMNKSGKAVPQYTTGQSLVRKINFKEYLDTWTKAATTKAEPLMRDESLENLVGLPETFEVDYGSLGKDLPVGPQKDMFKAIMYGTCRKQVKINQIKKIYLLYRSPGVFSGGSQDLGTPPVSLQGDSPTTTMLSRSLEGQETRDWEREVDKLVSWSHSLSVDKLEKE